MKYKAIENIMPTTRGYLGNRAGLQPMVYKRRGFISRFKAWWTGSPTFVNSMTTHDGKLFVATDKGLYVYDGKKLVNVPITT
jgi:ligand-binding sensor domain-containing protein